MEIPYSGLSNATTLVVMASAWLFINHRIRVAGTVVSRPTRLFQKFFLYFAIFGLVITVPYIILLFDKSSFPLAMALGYSLGHIFLFGAFIYIARMTFTLLPQFSSKERYAVVGGLILGTLTVALAMVTMVFGTQPSYDEARNITQYNVAPAVSALIGLSATLAVLPPGILFLISAFKNHGPARRRPLLLGCGLVLLNLAGPLNSIARDWQTYLGAAVFTGIGIILMGAGIVYRLHVDLTLQKAPETTSRL